MPSHTTLTLYIDISRFLHTRLNTGIQRVIKEFLLRSLQDNPNTNIIYFDERELSFKHLSTEEAKNFLFDTKNYILKPSQNIDILKSKAAYKIFFDLDAVWNATPKRTQLYPKLKQHNFKICNFIYDLIPIKFPSYLYNETKENFPDFVEAVFTHSDFIFFDSSSAKEDFLSIKNTATPTAVAHLGSDFTHETHANTATDYENLLNTKYILFVGTIEPRKKHSLVFEAFLELRKNHPKLHLVLIGKVGWGVEQFVNTLNAHPLKNKNIHHLSAIDDITLEQFYKNAYLVTYLSDYEGYGLPVAESLRYRNITITSKNSSMCEAGGDFADYLQNNDKIALIKLVSSYLQNKDIYQAKKENITTHYKPISWDDFYSRVLTKLQELYLA